MSLIIRCALGKGAPLDLDFKVKLGQWSPKQAEVVALAWAKHLDSKLPEPRLAPASDSEMGLTDSDKVEIDLKTFGKRALKPQVSDCGSAASAGDEPQRTFKVGDKVTVSRRVTWIVPRAGDEAFRQDLNVGQQGEVMGLADATGKWLLMKADVQRSDGSGVAEGLQQRINANNVTLTEVFNMRALQDEAKASGEPQQGPQPAAPKENVPKWALLDSEPRQVIFQKKWADLLAHADDLNRRAWAYGRMHVVLHSLYESLPTYANQEIMVLTRANSKGAWATEVWALKDSAAGEILFAPLSSQVKDTHISQQGNAVVTIPAHGHGSLPDGRTSVVLDGRNRMALREAGTCDEQEKRGTLFFLAQRTKDVKEANMALQPVSASISVDLSVPLQKRRKKHSWDSADMPTVPVLVNTKAVKKHTQLKMLDPSTSSEEKSSSAKKDEKKEEESQ